MTDLTDLTSWSSGTAAAIARARQHGVGDLLRRTALRYPGKLAVVDGERRATFAELDAAANRLANALTARGLTKGDRLALLSRNCWQYAVVVFATAKLGVVLVPVNFMLGADEIAYVLDHADASGVLAEDALAPTADAALASAGTGDVLAGICAAMRARGLPSFEAACAAVWLHGRAAEFAGAGLIADDVAASIPRALALLDG